MVWLGTSYAHGLFWFCDLSDFLEIKFQSLNLIGVDGFLGFLYGKSGGIFVEERDFWVF